MFNPRHMLVLAFACMALGISFLPAIASAETSPLAGAFTTNTTTSTSTTSTANCPSGNCFEVEAEWVEGISVTTSGGSGGGNGSGGGSNSSIVKETPVSKLTKIQIKKAYEKKCKCIVGYFQNPDGWQGPQSECVKPEKVKAWGIKPGDWIITTDHLGNPHKAKLKKGEKICGFHLFHKNGNPWIEGNEEECNNVHTKFPIGGKKLRKPRRPYVQFETKEKFFEIAIKVLKIGSESQGGSGSGSGEGGSASVKTPCHYQCKPGGVLNGKMCKYCPPPSCEPPCSSCEEEPPCPSCESVECCVKFGNEFEFEEAYVNEPPIHYWIDIFAPKGHNLSIYFETKEASFSPHEIKVPSAGAQSKFESQWFAPSHPGQYPVWVKVVDHTSGEICESEVQWVTVNSWELEEPPS